MPMLAQISPTALRSVAIAVRAQHAADRAGDDDVGVDDRRVGLGVVGGTTRSTPCRRQVLALDVVRPLRDHPADGIVDHDPGATAMTGARRRLLLCDHVPTSGLAAATAPAGSPRPVGRRAAASSVRVSSAAWSVRAMSSAVCDAVMWLRLRFRGTVRKPRSMRPRWKRDVERGVVGQRVVEVAHDPVREVADPDRAEAGRPGRDPQPVGDLLEAERASARRGRTIWRWTARSSASSASSVARAAERPDRVSVVRAAEHHVAAGARVEAVHDVGAAADRGDRVAVGHRLGERRQVRA